MNEILQQLQDEVKRLEAEREQFLTAANQQLANLTGRIEGVRGAIEKLSGSGIPIPKDASITNQNSTPLPESAGQTK